MYLPSNAQWALLIFASMLLLCMVPAWRCSRRDARSINGVGVWIKPLKFMVSLALFAMTTAALMTAAGNHPEADASMSAIAVLVMVTSTFELAYITLQASLGKPSHYNTTDSLHRFMTMLMALGALGLTASQAWLGWVVVRYNPDWASSIVVIAVVTGLFMTFFLATISGFLVAIHRAPSGTGTAVAGWHRYGDLRPAHFMGVHSQQSIPLLGMIAGSLPGSAAYAGFAVMACAYMLAWAALTFAELRHWKLRASAV